MLAVAAAGLAAHAVWASPCTREPQRESMNIRAAYPRSLPGTRRVLAGAIVAAIAITVSGSATQADAVASILIGLRPSSRGRGASCAKPWIVLEATPQGMWTSRSSAGTSSRSRGSPTCTTSTRLTITSGVNVRCPRTGSSPPLRRSDQGVLDLLGECLQGDFPDIEHSTFQLETAVTAAASRNGSHA